MLRVLLADDHELFRDGLCGLIDTLYREVVVDTAGDFSDVRRLALQIDYDLALLDLDMPGYEDGAGLQRAQLVLGETPVIVISALESEKIIQRALAAGVRAYLPKSSSNEVIISVIRLVLAGGEYCPPLGRRRKPNPSETSPHLLHGLTEREIEVLTLLASGMSNKEIARDMAIAGATVKTHVASIFRTLEVHNRTQAARAASELGLV